MKEIRKFFTKETQNCFKDVDDAELLKAFYGEKIKSIKDNIEIDDNFCGSPLNRYIKGVNHIQGNYNLTIDDYVTSLAVGVQEQSAVSFIGTSGGSVMKYKIESNDSKLLFEHKLYKTFVPDVDQSIKPEPVFGSKQEYLYL